MRIKLKNTIIKTILLFVCVFTLIVGLINFVPKSALAQTERTLTIVRLDENGNEKCNGQYIYFGSYPQSKVSDNAIISALNVCAGTLPTSSNSQQWTSYDYYINGNNTDFSWYIDIEHTDGEKYRGVYFTNYRSDWVTKSISTSKQEASGYALSNVYWFKFEPMKWRILSEQNGKAYLLSESLIDSQEYQSSYKKAGNDDYNFTDYYLTDVPQGNYILSASNKIHANNYIHSSIRGWLNSKFYGTAFNDSERAIIERTVVNNDISTMNNSSLAGTFVCEDTRDYVFLPSYSDLLNENYNFPNKTDLTSSFASRQKSFSQYAQAQGAMGTGDREQTRIGGWWLRSPSSDYGCYATMVDLGGRIMDAVVENTTYGVCPAIMIESPKQMHTYDSSCDISCNECDATRLNESQVGIEYLADDFVNFGSYPQARVDDDNLIASLNSLAGTLPSASNAQNWTSYGYFSYTGDGSVVTQPDYMWYIDISYNGENFRGVYFSDYRARATTEQTSYQQTNGYSTSTVYWFQYQPIKWKILSQQDNLALMVCQTIIDAQQFHSTYSTTNINGLSFYANNYENSYIREWLNSSFYTTAFNSLQKKIVVGKAIDNSKSATIDDVRVEKYLCSNTIDKVFLLSYQDALNNSYFSDDASRIKTHTDYALCQGLQQGSQWYLRSPAVGGNHRVMGVEISTGKLDTNKACHVNNSGIVPAIYLELPSTEHIGKAEKLVDNNDGTHDVLYDCCNAFVKYEDCSAVEIYDDCSKQQICSCGHILKEANVHDYISGTEYQIDSDGHSKKCANCSIYDTKQSHRGGTSNCQTQKVCQDCLTKYGQLGEHSFSNTYLAQNADSNKHYHVCEICGEKDEGQIHSPNIPNATEESAKFCITCQYLMEAQLGHIHLYEEIVEEDLKIADASCTSCAKYYKSCKCGDISTETFEYGQTLSHNFSILEYDKFHHWYKCSRCIETDTKQEHQFGSDNFCTVCDYQLVIDQTDIIIEVVNGTSIEGITTIVVNQNENVTVTANTPPQGKVFKGWAIDGLIISTETSYTFNATESVKLVAIYGDEVQGGNDDNNENEGDNTGNTTKTEGYSLGVLIGVGSGVAVVSIVLSLIICSAIIKKKKGNKN